MADKKKTPGGERGSKVGDALRGLSQSKGAEEAPPARHTTPLEIGTHPVEEDQPLMAREFHLFGPSNTDRAIFCRQLATMIEVGIPLLQSLKMLSKRTAHPKLAQAIGRVAQRVEEGESVSQALEADRYVFSSLICNIIKVGEVGGILEDSLVRLAQIIESKASIKRKVVAALAYPFVALSVAFMVIIVILTQAVPVFVKVYDDADAEDQMPMPTMLVKNISDFTINYFPIWLPLLILAVVGGYYFTTRTPGGRRLASLISLKFPVVGRITQKIGVARFSRTLGGLLSAGVPLVDCLEISADTNENVIIAESLRGVHRSVEKGEKMAPGLARTRVFPPLVIDMIAIGEETGTLDRMLEKVADIYDAEVDATLSGLSSIIEPMLIIFLGGTVIFIALAVMLPYFNLVDII